MSVALSWLGGTILGGAIGAWWGWHSEDGDMPGLAVVFTAPIGALVGGAIGVVGGVIFS